MSRLYVPYWFISCPKHHLKKISNNISDLIYAQLKQDIFSFVLKPGQRFTETDLAERYAASRTPIRQALYRLEQEGFVHVHFRSGWEIRPLEFRYYQELLIYA